MKTIVALVDLSDTTFKVLKQAHAFATAFHSQVVILHVVPEVVVHSAEEVAATVTTPTAEDVAIAARQLEELQESMVKFGVEASVEQLRGSTVETILSESRRLDADLIILGSHGHGALYNLFVGSVAADLLKRIWCPVLVVPSDPPADAPSA